MAFLKLRYLNQYLKNKQWWESSTWITVNRTSNKPKYWLWGNLYSQMTFVFHCRADSYEVGNVPKRLWITVDFIYLHPQSQNPIYCHPQKTKQFFSAVVNHPTLMFVAECVRYIRFPATFFFIYMCFYFKQGHQRGYWLFLHCYYSYSKCLPVGVHLTVKLKLLFLWRSAADEQRSLTAGEKEAAT